MAAPTRTPNRNLLRFVSASLALPALSACDRTQARFERQVREQLARQPLTAGRPLAEADLAHLPPPVRRYLVRSGALGKPATQSFRVDLEATMFRKPGGAPLPSRAVQYSFVGQPARLFFMRSRMMGLPVKVLHVYVDGRATMRVRVASLFDVVDARGPELDVAETVTVLNDLCVLAPAALAGPRFGWEAVDDRTARVTFTNGPHRVSAVLHFDTAGDLVDFVSDDRYALQDDGTQRRVRWSTPLRDYQDFGGRRVARLGEAIWHYPEGDFTYGKFVVRSIAYDVERLQPE